MTDELCRDGFPDRGFQGIRASKVEFSPSIRSSSKSGVSMDQGGWANLI